MTQYLPPPLLALFAPRDPLPYKPPTSKLAHERKNKGFGCLSDYTHMFEKASETPALAKTETKLERIERIKREREELAAYRVEQAIALWDPETNKDATSNPFKTLFLSRLNYDTSESKLRREFEVYGSTRRIIMVKDKITGKSRGYAFIEYSHEHDMHAAYKKAYGKKIDGRRITVDVERGRTVKGWLPRRLGGGKGGRKEVTNDHETDS